MRTLACILSLISIASSAQQSTEPVTARPRMFYGMVLGGNVSNLYLNGSSGSGSPGLGYRIGLSATYELSTHLSFQGSLAFLMEKHSSDFGTPVGGMGPLVIEYKYFWVEMPVTANYTFIRRKRISIFAGAGASLRRFVSLGYEVSSGQAYNSQPIDNVNAWNVFPILQLGMVLEPSNRKRMGATISYQANSLKLFHPVVLADGNTLPATNTRLSSFNLTCWYSISL